MMLLRRNVTYTFALLLVAIIKSSESSVKPLARTAVTLGGGALDSQSMASMSKGKKVATADFTSDSFALLSAGPTPSPSDSMMNMNMMNMKNQNQNNNNNQRFTPQNIMNNMMMMNMKRS